MRTSLKYFFELALIVSMLAACAHNTEGGTATSAWTIETASSVVDTVESFSDASNAYPSSVAETSEEILSLDTGFEITFPLSTVEKNEYNAHIYETTPFVVSVSLPEGWGIEDSTVLHQKGVDVCSSVDGIFSVLYLLDEKGEPVGSIGYNLAPEVDVANRDPMALFAGITLAQHHFNCHEAFTPIRETETQLLALTDVITSKSANEQEGDGNIAINYGILLRDEDLGIYVAIELQANALTKEQVRNIADSLSVTVANRTHSR